MAMTTDLVSSTIVARAQEPEGIGRMMIASVIGHVLAFGVFFAWPLLFGTQAAPEVTMTFDLMAGAPGVDTGGRTSISGKAVQEVAPKTELPKPTPPKPPPPKAPEMTENVAKPTTKPTTKQPSTSTRPAPPTTGEAVRSGQSRVETQSPSNEGGLSTGGMGGNASQTNIDFCDPQYLAQMVSLIHRSWQRQQGGFGAPVIRYVIQRDGTLTDITVRRSSGSQGRDFEAQRAVMLTRAIPPLPSCYPHSDYAVSLTFEYIR
jgi:TonB family protein